MQTTDGVSCYGTFQVHGYPAEHVPRQPCLEPKELTSRVGLIAERSALQPERAYHDIPCSLLFRSRNTGYLNQNDVTAAIIAV